MSTRKTTLFYFVLTVVASLAVGMVIASRLDLTPASSAQTMAVPAMNSAPLTGGLSADTFRVIAKAQSPMVVNVTTEIPQKSQDLTEFFGGGGGAAPDDFFHRFFGTPGQQDDQQESPRGRSGRGGAGRAQREPKSYAAGTGFIISKDGLILTNNHVIEGASKIDVQLYGDESDVKYTAKVIGHDQLTDSALIQLVDKPNHPLPEAKFGDSSQMAPGDWVMAIGDPFNFAYTITVGVISATKRSFPVTDGRSNDMLQTDAAINPGNSGGPLLNVRGEVIGINTAIISNSRTEGNIGIGFAVPINTVRDLLPQLRAGKVIRGRIGVQVAAVPREGYEDFGLTSRAGAIVSTVTPDHAAAKAGLQPGDVIVQYNGRSIKDRDELVAMVIATKPGTTVPIKVLRNKQEKTLNVTVEELDLENEQAGSSAPRRGGNDQGNEQPQEESSGGFGVTLSNVTPQISRRAQLENGRTGALVTDVDPSSSAAAQIRPGDIILSVNGRTVSNASDAKRELDKVESGRIARLLLWRTNPNGEVFVAVKKD
jgi:serine protease Do